MRDAHQQRCSESTLIQTAALASFGSQLISARRPCLKVG
jgi:hypothetical protein